MVLAQSVSLYFAIKKESPNEGTETRLLFPHIHEPALIIKKESPNEGTETISTATIVHDDLNA